MWYTISPQTHRRRLIRKRNKLGTLKTDIQDLSTENSELHIVLREEAVKVTERQLIQDIAGEWVSVVLMMLLHRQFSGCDQNLAREIMGFVFAIQLCSVIIIGI